MQQRVALTPPAMNELAKSMAEPAQLYAMQAAQSGGGGGGGEGKTISRVVPPWWGVLLMAALFATACGLAALQGDMDVKH